MFVGMKGVILAGGSGTRLYPITMATSKQLMPIYNKPMINYPLATLISAGIREILIISTPEYTPEFQKYLKDGSQFGCKFTYKVQPRPEGLAQAFELAEEFLGGDSACMVLGDNLFYGSNFQQSLINAKKTVDTVGGGVIFAYQVVDPERYGVVEFDSNGEVLSIEEKPKKPRSNFAIPGIYFFDNQCVEAAKNAKISKRGEKEITEIQNHYFNQNKLKVEVVDRGTAWLDTGTFDSMMQASEFVRVIEERQGLMVGCVEEEAFKQGFMTSEMLKSWAEPLLKSGYGKYLLNLLK